MLRGTHISITLFFVLLLIPKVDYKITFVVVALISTLMPDIDSKFSSLGKKKSLRILQFFAGHRKIFHSFVFLLIITFLLVVFFPKISLGFFLGYGLHLLGDSFTVQGIMPFYPYKRRSKGRIKTGGKSETVVFIVFVIIDVLFLIGRISSYF